MLDFGLLPPEVNSTLIYSGPGAGSMVAAATAWQGLSAELHRTATSYRSLLSGLVAGPWLGPAAVAMSAAAAPHLEWLSATAAQAEEAGVQVTIAASAYEAAFTGMVPPAEVSANRALLQTLVATNIFGQNTAAIAVVEADYAEMWAQAAAAMYGYAGSSAAATELAAFGPPRAVISLNGSTLQAAAVAQAVGGVVAGDLDELLRLTKAMPNALQGLAGSVPGSSLEAILRALGLIGHEWTPDGDGIVLNGVLGALVAGLTGSSTLDASTFANTYIRLVSPIRLTTTAMKDVDGLAHEFVPAASHAAKGAAVALDAVPQGIPKMSSGLDGGLSGIGKAARIGGLSVPNAWATATPGLGRVATVPLSPVAAAAVAAEPNQHVFGGAPPTGGPGRLAAASGPRYGFHPTVMARPPFGG